MSQKLMLVDGSALVYRSFFALQQTGLTTSSGLPTGALLGFTNTLLMLARQEQPDYWAVAFDAPGKNFRHELDSAYKANRQKAPDELREQMPWARNVVRAWPCMVLEESGVEADDVLGSLAARFAGPDLEVTLVSGDKDFYQLLGPHVQILNPGRGGSSPVDVRRISTKDVAAKFGVKDPGQVIEVLALMGDSSDNIPGVAGVGPKTAARLISEYGSVSGVYEAIDSMKPGRLRDNLEAHQDDALRSLELVTIKKDLDIDADLDSMRFQQPTGDDWVEVLSTLEFKNLVKEFGPDDSGTEEESGDWHLVESKAGLKEAASRLKRAGSFAFEVVADGLDVAGVALAHGAGEAWYVNVAHTSGSPVGVEVLAEAFGDLFADFTLVKTTYGGKEAKRVLEHSGIEVQGLASDTMIAAYLVDPDHAGSLENLTRMHFGTMVEKPESLAGKGKNRLTAGELDPEAVCRIEGPRVSRQLDLAEILESEVRDASMESLYRELELPLSDVLRRMEDFGVKIDAPYLKKLSKRMDKELAKLETECWELADKEFNLGSPKQLAQVLFEHLQLPKGKKTKTGYSTDSEVLEMLRPHHDLPEKILEHRQISKLKNTYVDALPVLLDPETGRIHAKFNQTVAATGRLSSSDPNLQNIPIRTPLGREVRRAFIPEKGRLLVSADYSQVELRIMAELSEDEVLLEAFRTGVDVHLDTASRIFGVPPEKVTAEQRNQAKTVNFGILYGQGPFGLSRTLGIPQAEAKAFIAEYKKTYKGVIKYLDQTTQQAYRDGYVTTLLKRRRLLPGLQAKGGPARSAAERLAVNAPIQGSAADLIKVAMVRLDHQLAERGMEARMVAQVHDELLLECPEEEADAAATMVHDAMANAMEFKVPIVVNVGIGGNWEEIH